MDKTTQAYIDAEIKERNQKKSWRKARRESAQALRIAEEEERQIAAEKDQIERKHDPLIKLQKEEVICAKLTLREAKKKLDKELNTLGKYRAEMFSDLKPVRTKLRKAQERVRTVSAEFKTLDDRTIQPVGKASTSLYPDAPSWPGPQTNFPVFSQRTGVNPVRVPGGLVDGRGREKPKSARINVKRKNHT